MLNISGIILCGGLSRRMGQDKGLMPYQGEAMVLNVAKGFAGAKELLLNTDLNITEITYKIGINSRSYFSKLFKEKYGMSPKVFQNKNREDSGAYKTA